MRLDGFWKPKKALFDNLVVYVSHLYGQAISSGHLNFLYNMNDRASLEMSLRAKSVYFSKQELQTLFER